MNVKEALNKINYLNELIKPKEEKYCYYNEIQKPNKTIQEVVKETKEEINKLVKKKQILFNKELV